MENDPLAFFGARPTATVPGINDEWKKESLLTATAVSFALGMVASIGTVYILTVAHAFV